MSQAALVKDIFGESDDSDSDDDAGPQLSRLKKRSGDDDAKASRADSDDDDDDDAEEEEVVAKPPVSKKKKKEVEDKPSKKRSREEKQKDADDGNAYDSEEEPEETQADRAFIDTEGDDEDLLREYAQDRQDFRDDRVDAGFEDEPGLGTARDENDKGKNKEDETPIGQAMARMKRKKQKEMTQDEKDKVCMALLGRMNDAYLDDVDARGEGRPATQKMSLAPVVKRVFNQRALHNTLLEFDALVAVCDWLRPLADGSLPSLAIRSAMLQVMQQLPAQPEHLKKQTASGTNVGRVVMKYSRDPRETPENRRLARQLVEAWSRPVVGRGVSYKSLAAQQEQELGHVQGVLPRIDPTKDDADELIQTVMTADNATSQRVRVPQFKGFDYIVRPASSVSANSAPANRGGSRASAAAGGSLKFNPESAKGRIAKRVKKSSPGRAR